MSKGLRWILICLCLIITVGLIIYIYELRNIEVPDTAVREPREQHVIEAPDVEVEPTIPLYEQVIEPNTKPQELLPNLAHLREQHSNPDIIGFIVIPNTNISYPVVQTGNNDFYLYHDINWNVSSAGSIFLDYENNLYDLSDDNFIIYGHNMRNGSKFHNLRHFHREDFFRAHTYILLDTPYHETIWDIFSFFHTTTDFCYLTTNFHNRDTFYEFLMELQRRSIHTTDIVLSDEDQILILSTCAAIGGDNRYVVVARLRP